MFYFDTISSVSKELVKELLNVLFEELFGGFERAIEIAVWRIFGRFAAGRVHSASSRGCVVRYASYRMTQQPSSATRGCQSSFYHKI
jgi:hypothetical protein